MQLVMRELMIENGDKSFAASIVTSVSNGTMRFGLAHPQECTDKPVSYVRLLSYRSDLVSCLPPA